MDDIYYYYGLTVVVGFLIIKILIKNDKIIKFNYDKPIVC